MAFKRTATVLALASFTLAAGTARAETATFTAVAGSDVLTDIGGWPIGAGHSVATWQFSKNLIGALAIARVTAAGVAPGTVSAPNMEVKAFHVDMPLRSIRGVVDSDALAASVQRADFAGGIRLDVVGVLPSGKKNITSQGGSLTLSDFKIDFATKGVYVTLEGGNNVGIKRNQLLWNYTDVQGLAPVACNQGGGFGPDSGGCSALNAAGVKVSGMHITSDGFDLISASMGWTNFGVAAMTGVGDYGTLTISAVPEVTSSWLALAGIAVLGVAVRSRRAKG